MMILVRRLAGLVLLLCVAACAVWSQVQEPRVSGPQGLAFLAPVGWMRFNQAGDTVLLTRDGLGIQLIRIELRPHDRAFPALKKASSADMLPSEAADLLVAELKRDPFLANLRVVDNGPALLTGKPGFRVHGQYRDERGAPFDLVAVGRATDQGLLVAFYRSLTTHYFARDLPVYEQVLASLGGI